MKRTKLHGLFLPSLLALVAAPAFALGSGYLGVRVQEVPEALASHLDLDHGVMIEEVVKGTAADRAGLKRLDVVVAVAGEKVDGADGFAEAVRSCKAGEDVKLKVRRGDRTLELTATLGARNGTEAPRVEPPVEIEEKDRATDAPGFLGIQFDALIEPLAVHLGLDNGVGVMITEVLSDSPADRAGLEENDVLIALDGTVIDRPAAFPEAIRSKRAGETVRLTVIQQGRKNDLEVTLGEAPDEMVAPFPDLPGVGPDGAPMGRRPFLDPRSGFRGRLKFQDEDGNEHDLDIPGFDGDLDGLRGRLDEMLKERFDGVPPDLRKHLDELFKGLPDASGGFSGPAFPFGPRRLFKGLPPGATGESQSHSTSRWVEDGFDITIKDVNGFRSCTVKRDGKVLADDLPMSELDTLPEDVRERVESLSKQIPSAALGLPGTPSAPVLAGPDRGKKRRL